MARRELSISKSETPALGLEGGGGANMAVTGSAKPFSQSFSICLADCFDH